MTVIAFAPRDDHASAGWRTCELDRLAETFAGEIARGDASGWDTGATEVGDPQFYLLGPPPEHDCILCVSRLGKLYVLEDGAGHMVFENADFALLARQAKAWFKDGKARLLAQIVLTWGALRHAFEEKVEPLLVEGEEVLMHIAPQFAAMA
jgi:hypothetical protein